MPSSPNQLPPGKQYELRVAASSLELDEKLAAFTNAATQPELPGFLHLFSQEKFLLQVTDRDIDDHSLTETKFRSFGMQVTNHTRNKYDLEPVAEIIEQRGGNGLIITAKIKLGLQAAKEIMIAPFFTAKEKETQMIPLYYDVPDAIQRNKRPKALDDLRSFLLETKGGVIDELMLVERAVKFRSIRSRQRLVKEEVKAEEKAKPEAVS